MRLAVTSSSIRSSSLAIGVSFGYPSPFQGEGPSCAREWIWFRSQNEAHRAEAAELMGVDEHATLLDAERLAGALEDVAVGADIFPDALVAPVAIADEVGNDGDQVAVHAEDPHVGDH